MEWAILSAVGALGGSRQWVATQSGILEKRKKSSFSLFVCNYCISYVTHGSWSSPGFIPLALYGQVAQEDTAVIQLATTVAPILNDVLVGRVPTRQGGVPCGDATSAGRRRVRAVLG